MLPNERLPSSLVSLSDLTPYQLRALIVDYLSHNCYTKTAKRFIKDSMVRHLDADGNEIPSGPHGAVQTASPADLAEADSREAELREEIRAHILAGRVDDATSMLNEHFPSVLAELRPIKAVASTNDRVLDKADYPSPTSVEPAHLTLNLRIQSFVEACRTVPLPYPPPLSFDMPHPPEPSQVLDEEDPASLEQKAVLLFKAQKLYNLANALPKGSDHDLFLRELNNVSGLLAYKVPEKSPVAMYLSQERREAVADQINRAILERSSKPIVSTLEFLVRETMTVWSYAHQYSVKPRPGALLPPIPTLQQPLGKDQEVIVPPFDLQHFINIKT